MKLDRYEIKSDGLKTTYKFLSEGPKGKIEKIIQFPLVNNEDLYNLAFGDKDADTGNINDRSITDNGDSEKVLATVVSALYTFCDKFPSAWIYATGSMAARTRLYRMGIKKYFEIVKTDFHIYGQAQSEWERFEKVKLMKHSLFSAKNLKFGIMKSILELNEKKIPVVPIDKALNKYSNVVLFPEKVAKAKKAFEKLGLPNPKHDTNS